MKIKGKKLLVLAMAATFLFASISSLAEEVESRKLSILQVTGDEAYVMKGNQRKITAVAGMNLAQGNQVSTGKSSSVYIEADGDKTLKLDSSTVVEITKASAKSLKLTLKDGRLFFNVDKPLAADEELKFEAAHTSMSIRGTSGIFTFKPETLTFYLIEGEVEWDLGNGQTLNIDKGEKVELVRDWGDEQPGPGVEKRYVLKQLDSFDWTDLDADGLAAVLENRDKLDLSVIGLGSTGELEKAEAVVQENEAAKQAKKATVVEEDDDDDNDEGDVKKETVEQPSVDDESSAEETLEQETTEEETSAEESTEESTEASTEAETEESTEEPTEAETEESTAPGDYLYSSASSADTWVEYVEGQNGYYDTTTSEWTWDKDWLTENGLTETP